jgi:hypothetical protein
VSGEEILSRFRGVRLVGKRDIAVGADKIERAPGESGVAVLLSPGEDVEPQPASVGPGRKLGALGAVHMRLPSHRRQRAVVVAVAPRDPRQAVAAMDASRFPFTQRTAAAARPDLRDRPEGELSHGFDREGRRDDGWGDP